MNNELESAIAGVFTSSLPDFTETIRKLRESGAPKSDVVRLVTRATQGKPFMRSGLLIAVDEIWAENH